MRTASPWWLSLTLGIGLAFVFLGERLLFTTSLRGPLTMIGVILVISSTAVRAWTTFGTSGARRKIERTLLMCHLVTLAALVLYALTTDWGIGMLTSGDESVKKVRGALTVLYSIFLVISLIPVLMIELSLGTTMRDKFDLTSASASEENVEYYRVRELGWSALTIALAMGFLMVTCNVASERNIQRDVSYFKTSSPGDSTTNIVKSFSEPLRVMLFFPAVNEVKEQVKDYFDALSARAGEGRLSIELADQEKDKGDATKYKIVKDGTVVLIRGTGDNEKFEKIELDTNIENLRKSGKSKLRTLDREVNAALMKVARDKRKAYVIAGHGEMTDPDSIPPSLKGSSPPLPTQVLKKRALPMMNYELKELGIMELAKDVPDDATIVILLAPVVPLQPAEWDSIVRYLDRGGRLLFALDPRADRNMGPLEAKLGLRFNPGDLTDDKSFSRQRGNISDRRFVLSSQVSSHASTTTLSKFADRSPVTLIDSGALEEIALPPGTTRTITVRSMDSSFLDFNNNFAFDAGTEKRQRWNIGAAVEGPKTKDADGKDKDGFRALVFADTNLFMDALDPVRSQLAGQRILVMVSEALFFDGIRWLGGEETFAGELVSEEDKPIQHTKDKDAKWFILMIIGAPLIVLGVGLFLGSWNKRKRRTPLGQAGKEVK
ncbi:MAG: Gldg family protein [Kofleriaceae bacterium]